MSKKTVEVSTEKIKLDQFLKWADVVGSGGEAKILIKAGEIKVNGEVTTQRGKLLTDEDVVTYGDSDYLVHYKG